MPEALSREVFDAWKEADEQFKADMREHILLQLKLNLDLHGRTVALETYRANDAIKLGIFSTFVSALFGTVAALWRH